MSRFNKGDVEKKAESSGWQVHGGKSVHVSVPKDQWTATLQESHRKAGVYSAGAEHLATRICNRDGQCEGRPNRPSEPQELKASEGIVGLAFRNQGPEFELLPEDDFPGPKDVLYLRRVLHDEWIGCVATWQQADLDAARAEAKEIYAELFELAAG